MFWILFPDQIHDSNCFLSFFESPFHSVDSVLDANAFLILMDSNFYYLLHSISRTFFSPNENSVLG